MTAETDLLPCPFCGTAPQCWGDSRWTYIRCGNDQCIVYSAEPLPYNGDTHWSDAITEWNTRANLAELQRENTRLVGCLTQANHNAEEFERKWYIAGDERDAEKARSAELQREVEGLRAEVETRKEDYATLTAMWRADEAKYRDLAEQAEARAERLAEALRGMMAEYAALHARHDLGECQATVDARAALDQETTNG